VESGEFFFMNLIIFVSSKFGNKLLAADHLIIQQRTKSDTEQKTLKFLLEIMTLVSTKYNIGSDTEFILRRMSFIYNRDTRIDLWGTPCFSVPSQRKHFQLNSMMLLQPYIFCC